MNKSRTIKTVMKHPFRRLASQIQSEFLGAPEGMEKQPRLRVILYSHDTMGVGHMRRNLLIAQQISRI